MKTPSDMPKTEQKRYKRKGLWIVSAIIVVALLVWKFFPYQSVAEKQIMRLLTSYGIKVQEMEISQLDTHNLSLPHLALEGTHPLTVDGLHVGFSPKNIAKGKLNQATAEHIDMTLYHNGTAWKIGGLEALRTSGEASPSDISRYFSPKDISALAPDNAAIQHMSLSMLAPQWALTLPLSLTFTLQPKATLTANAFSPITWDAKPYKVTANAMRLSAILSDNDHSWEGTLNIPSIAVSGIESPLPPLTLEGVFSLTKELLHTNMRIFDSSKQYRSKLTLSIPLDKPDNGVVDIQSLAFPWGNGTIRVKTRLPLAPTEPVPVTLYLEKVELASLMDAISNGEIKASGRVTGELPILYHPDGNITLQPGAAEALEAGNISVPPNLLPGENSSLALARDALKNFHYTTLKITVSSSEGHTPVVTLSIAGKNPDVLEGREIKLNVNLSGDILPLIQQSLLPFNDVKQLLKLQDTP